MAIMMQRSRGHGETPPGDRHARYIRPIHGVPPAPLVLTSPILAPVPARAVGRATAMPCVEGKSISPFGTSAPGLASSPGLASPCAPAFARMFKRSSAPLPVARCARASTGAVCSRVVDGAGLTATQDYMRVDRAVFPAPSRPAGAETWAPYLER